MWLPRVLTEKGGLIECQAQPSQPGLDTLDPDLDNSFFSLGGDSIAAAEAAWLCSKAGLHLTLALQAALVAGQVQRPQREKPGLSFGKDWKYA